MRENRLFMRVMAWYINVRNMSFGREKTLEWSDDL